MHIRNPALASLLLQLTFLMACTFQAEAPQTAPRPAPETPDMDVFWARHNEHFMSGNLDAALDNLTEDFVLVEAFNQPVKGLEKLRAAMERGLASSDIKELSLDSTETHDAGSWLVDIGTFSETAAMKGQQDREFTLEGNYIAILQRDNSGAWKVQRFMSVPSKPFPPEIMAAMETGDQAAQ